MLMLCGRTGYTWYNTLFTVRMVSGLFESNLVAEGRIVEFRMKKLNIPVGII